MVQENTRGADLKIGAAFLLPDRISGCISIAEVKPGSRTNIRSFNGPALLAVVCGGPFSRTAREISARGSTSLAGTLQPIAMAINSRR